MVMGALERLSPPRVLGDMTLLATLGEGGMATVYLACHGRGNLARLAAVKLLRRDLPDHDYRTRFLDEARVVVRLHHNNLVDVRAAGEIGDQLYIAMEAVEGRDLADVWDRCAELGHAFPVPLAVHICREVLRGLHYAHTFPGLALVHRDVSPSNILIDWAGAVRLADFGLATSTLKATATVPGVVFGKVGYMSPEQALRQPLDGRVDLYAVGVVLWELLTGKPMRAPDGLDTDAVAAYQARRPSTLSKRVDPELDDIVVRALARDREERWPTAEAMMVALGRWLARRSPETGQEQLARFMAELFGPCAAKERELREALMREGTAGYEGGSGTRLFIHERTDPLDREPVEPDGPGRRAVRAEPNEAIEAGTVIAERYRVLSRLGRGGMGTVYLGEHVTVGRSVAIKVLTHEWSSNEGITQRFRAEARAASAAGHPNIVEVFDAGELPDGRLYLVMEFLTGRNLFEEVEAVGPLGVARACHIIRDVARAIRAAHEVGIIHRDLKPDNVMLVDRGRGEGETVKVLDFGISASAHRGADEDRLTVAGQALGTPHYMAPEQARGCEPTERFDIYALGVIFYELLTARTPFEGANMVEVMTRKSLEPAPSVATLREGLAAELVTLIDNCLEIDPDKRPASARVFLARLEEVLRTLPRDSRRAAAAAGAAAEPAASASRSRDSELGEVSALAAHGGGGLATSGGRSRRIGAGVAISLVAASAALLLWWVDASRRSPAIADRGGASSDVDLAPDGPAPIAARPPAPSEGEASSRVGEHAHEEETSPASEPPSHPSAGSGLPVDTRPPAGGVADRASPAQGSSPGPSSPVAPDAGGKPTPVAASPKWASSRCQAIREQAEAAEADRSWRSLLTKLASRECWENREDHRRMQVHALKELELFAECADAGRGSTDAKVKGWTSLCEKRAAAAGG